jgi:hypothetical protein
MAKVNVKETMEKAKKMNDAWVEGAPDVEFGGVTQKELADDIADVDKDIIELDETLAKADMIRARIENKVGNVGTKRVRVGNGVRANPDYGTDSPLYGAMGFVRDSDRASGLTRKRKTPTAR